MNKKILAALLAFSMTLGLAACGGSGSNGGGSSGPAPASQESGASSEEAVDTVKIAAFFNFSGAGADTGIIDGDGAQFAADFINGQGGVKSLGGAKIEIVKADTLSDASQAKAVAERIISENPGLVGAVGAGGSGYTLAMGSVFEKAQIPYVQTGVSAQISEQGYKYVYQPVPTTFGQTQIEFVQWLNEKQGKSIHKVGIIYEDTDYGLSTAEGNLELAESAGLEVVFDQSFPANGSDVSSLITNLKASGAELVLPVAFTQDAKLIFNTMASMNYHPLVLGGGAGFLYPAFAEELGDAVDGVLSVSSNGWDTAMFNLSEELKDVPAQFEEKYGYFMNEHSLGTFNCIYLIWKALENCGTTEGPALTEAIRALNIPSAQPSSAADGTVSFNENGKNVNSIPVIIQWQKSEDGVYRPRTVYPEAMIVDSVLQTVE